MGFYTFAMPFLPRAARPLALLLPIALLSAPLPAQDNTKPATAASADVPAPKYLQTGDKTPWLYVGSDIPHDKQWVFGEMPNGLRYAVRHNGVPPGQVSIRVRIDAGSLYETDAEQGFAHLLEHMTFRQSKYLGDGEAIPTFQRLGATFGTDTNAQTTPTETVFQLDLPNADEAKLDQVFKLLSGMIEAPTLSAKGLSEDLPIVLAEKRERGSQSERVSQATRETLFHGQPLANRLPIGTEATLNAATPATVRAFHDRWYRPENTMIAVAGDADPDELAGLVEKWFGGWQGKGPHVPAPSFGVPTAPPGVNPERPVGETRVLVEPDLPRNMTYAVLRPWHQVHDNIKYNQGLLLDAVAQAIINRRLEARARTGGSYLYAQVQEDKPSRSADATFVTFAPLTTDWKSALLDVRGVIADAIDQPPTQAEIDREAAELDVAFQSQVEQSAVQAGSKLADDLVQAVDIRETVASPQTVLQVFRSMKDQLTPQNVLEHTRELFKGNVVRAIYVTPTAGEATAAELRAALEQPVKADASSRVSAKSLTFADLPPVGPPGTVVSDVPIGVLDIKKVTFSNGVHALLWSNGAEPGRVAVKVRFGSGYRGFDAKDAVYASIGEKALVPSGVGPLDIEDLDRISTGRKMGFDFDIDDAVFDFSAQTRQQDLADQLYLFAAKLANPRWDANPVRRAIAADKLAYESYSTSPEGVLTRDLTYYERNKDPRFKTPTPAELDAATPEGFKATWAPLLKQGPVEVLVFGEFDEAKTIDALAKTFGALPPREPIPAAALARTEQFPPAGEPTVVLHHNGDADQAAAVIAWPTAGGVAGLPESRQLQILVNLFNNRLLEEMRERTGASYSPQVVSDWPEDLDSGGTITALGQLKPADVPAFFAAADKIVHDLQATPPTAAELERVTEPLKQMITRASTGNTFWLWQLEGASTDPQRVAMLRSLLRDYSRTTPAAMQALAKKYFGARPGWRMAIIPDGQRLATKVPAADIAKEAAASR
ncbi:M16 family metallopeptidase [Tsuneonella mangrovi]|uniref:M16 family metallopeptidase n=1 Tax=Tsuneonella mangrovi TaxID=1982042 RepID=UPI001F0A0FDE|nr:insulinase family protein [Tsuneonella mangrovi]